MRRHKNIAIALLVALFVFIVLVDRVAWASVASWREDQAANIWLGYTRTALQVPVGLISSMHLPNPNGLIMASVLLSRLPDLWVIGTVLGLVQAALLVWVGWLMTHDVKLLAVIIGPLLSSIALRGTSVDLWGQWTLIPINCLFMAGLLIFLRRSTLWALPIIIAACLMAPSIYLSGIVNAIVYVLLTTLVGILRPPGHEKRLWVAPLLTSAGIIALSLWLTWAPYFREVGTDEIIQVASGWSRSAAGRLLTAVVSIIRFPVASLDQFASRDLYLGGQLEPEIVSPALWSGYLLLLRHSRLQGIICYVSILLGCASLVVRRRPLVELVASANRAPAIGVVLMSVFVVACYVVAPLIGGPAWGEGERHDQVMQFLPFILVLWFLGPLLLESPGWIQPHLRRLTWISAALFTTVSLVIGLLVVKDNLTYRGRKLTNADVPLMDKLRLVDFVARDWKAASASPEIPIDYDLGGGRWDWITDFGAAYLEWYPAPYTIGRAFDYQLLRSYGLRNVQEGIQQRTFGNGRYLVTYAFNRLQVLNGHAGRSLEFGRLRLTIFDDLPAP
jgi:hypothetical protein